MTASATPDTAAASAGPAQPIGERIERAAAAQAGATYVLRLYIASLTPRSMTAIRCIRAVCETHLKGHYELEIIDIYEQPTLARRQQIVAAPTLIKERPLPLRRLIGDMASQERVLAGLGLRPTDAKSGDTT